MQVLSQRGIVNTVARCVGWELEDCIADLEGIDLAVPVPTRRTRVGRRILERGAHRLACTGRVNPGYRLLTPVPPSELLFMVCQFTRDVPAVNALRRWRRRADVAVVWIEEIWAADVGRWRAHTELLRSFDHIVVSCSQSVDAIRRATGRPCTYLPPGVDALRFNPGPRPPQRTIDVMNVGRRSPVTHAALQRRPDLFCYFDTTLMRGVRDAAEHRRLYAELAKRSRYFITNSAKFDQPGQTRHQHELGFRFFEAAAAGAVLLGDHPRGAVFNEHFGWEDALIDLPADAPHVGEVIDELDADPVRLDAVRRRNMANALRRHDWSHRWAAILDLAGLEPGPALQARLVRTSAMADELDASGGRRQPSRRGRAPGDIARGSSKPPLAV